MPYITKARAEEITNNPQLATNPGDQNYLFTVEFVRMWRENPCYATFHQIARCGVRPETDKRVWDLSQSLKPHTKETDIIIARDEAINEFRRRVMGAYEDKKLNDPNNVDPYAGILEKPIDQAFAAPEAAI